VDVTWITLFLTDDFSQSRFPAAKVEATQIIFLVGAWECSESHGDVTLLTEAGSGRLF